MSETPDTPGGEGLDRIAAIKRARGAKLGAAKKATTRKPPTRRPPTKPSTKTTPGVQVATLVKTLTAVAELRFPVHATIVRNQADALGGILDRLAVEDPRVGEFLEKLTTFGNQTTKLELAMLAASTAAACAVASGVQTPITMALGGSLAEPAAVEVAGRIVAAEAIRVGRVHADGSPIVEDAAVQLVVEQLLAPRRPRPVREDQDQGDAAATS